MSESRITHVDAIFGQLVAKKRKFLGIEQLQLADRLDMTQSALSRLERGESSATLATQLKLAECFNTSLVNFMYEFEQSIQTVSREKIDIVPKKDAGDGKMLAFVGGAALAALLLSGRS
ncbi:helix-turn-helix transcriptional regulator [Ascidiaceihabitans sp.]|uniref:helix-turn-helix domain-containing protein n=1 Tax=Ascidiaceihabitans sp. TaxID=1872644 RepID=UPI00329A5FCC